MEIVGKGRGGVLLIQNSYMKLSRKFNLKL